MKKFILIVQIVLFAFTARSQITIQGTLIDSLTKAPVPYSSIVVKNNNDSIINGSLTNEKGFFKIEVKTVDGIKLIANNVSYKELEIPLSNLDNAKTIKLGNIQFAQKAIALKEASVAEQNQVVQKFDRKVYSMSDKKVASAKTSLDLLRTLPGVTVDEQGNVRYKGADAEIYVDDMPSEYLYPDKEMIPVTEVDKIELIDASMRSGGSGKGGIINIKMKKVKDDGLSGVVNTRNSSIDFNRLAQYNNYINANYKKKKITVFSNLWQYSDLNYRKSLFDGSIYYNNQTLPYNENSEYDFRYGYFSEYTGLIIDASPKTKIIIAGGFNGGGNNSTSSLTHEQIIDGNYYNQYNYERTSKQNWLSSGTYIYFRHTYDTTSKELSGYIYYSPYDIRNNAKYTTDYNFIYQNGALTNDSYTNTQINNNRRAAISSHLYYNHPISEKSRWNIDYSGRIINNTKNENITEINNVESLPFYYNNYGLQNSQKLSCRIGTMLGKWKLDGGLTGKLDNNNIKSKRYLSDNSDTLISINKTYLNILPSTTISYTLDSLQELKLTYARTAETPWFTQLIPYVDKQNPIYWYSGNKDLKSVNYNNIYLGYTYTKPMWNFSAEAFYSITNNEVEDITYPVSEVTTMFIYDNIALNSKLGIDLSYFRSFKGKLTLNLSSSIYYDYLDATSIKDNVEGLGLPDDDYIKRSYAGNIKLTTNYSIGKLANAMFYLNYYSREVTYSGYDYGYINSTINFSYRFFKKHLTMVVGVNNLLDDLMKHGSYHNSTGLVETRTDLDASSYSRSYFISLRYVFRQGDRNTGNIRGQ